MDDLYALIAFAAGIPMILIGYIWCLVVSKQFSTGWMVANLFVLPLLAFAFMHWSKVRLPFIILVVGIVLVQVTMSYLPQG